MNTGRTDRIHNVICNADETAALDSALVGRAGGLVEAGGTA